MSWAIPTWGTGFLLMICRVLRVSTWSLKAFWPDIWNVSLMLGFNSQSSFRIQLNICLDTCHWIPKAHAFKYELVHQVQISLAQTWASASGTSFFGTPQDACKCSDPSQKTRNVLLSRHNLRKQKRRSIQVQVFRKMCICFSLEPNALSFAYFKKETLITAFVN